MSSNPSVFRKTLEDLGGPWMSSMPSRTTTLSLWPMPRVTARSMTHDDDKDR